MELELNVLWNTDKTRQNEELGIDSEVSDYDLKKCTFYKIDALIPYDWTKEEDGFCRIMTGGETFIIPLLYEEVKEKIKRAKITSPK
jgi:hypothetical protein